MSKLLGFFACSFLLPALAVTACGDDSSDEVGGGQAGHAGAGAAAGAAASGGSGEAAANGQAGGRHDGAAGEDGVAGADTAASAGAGGAGAGGAPTNAGGDGGDTGEGGTNSGGAAGANGKGDGCLGAALPNRLCAAFEARACDQPVDCVACVKRAKEQRVPYEACAPCASAFDAWHQCAVSAFEGGSVAEGVECVDGYAEVHGDNCASHLGSAIECSVVAGTEGCPASWPE